MASVSVNGALLMDVVARAFTMKISAFVEIIIRLLLT
jgi:hypothetical protein